ncbi:hypothetical protein DEO72_LG5g342 [Vigna unguiculata]|uniref:Uncharacterized protein n=1 Tax=Vigna unguiculata TaxID=3917 RepID=A0A4D6LV15_VIGUN|nr:hypothetical protein DEO72_LG5g342 [Vigna unguiculata]
MKKMCLITSGLGSLRSPPRIRPNIFSFALFWRLWCSFCLGFSSYPVQNSFEAKSSSLSENSRNSLKHRLGLGSLRNPPHISPPHTRPNIFPFAQVVLEVVVLFLLRVFFSSSSESVRGKGSETLSFFLRRKALA